MLRAIRLLPLLALALPAPAQEEGTGNPFWVSTPSNARAFLRRARAAAAAGDWTASAHALQEVFERYSASFVPNGPGRYSGARARGMELLVRRKPLREEYERLYGADARQLLNRALASREQEGLWSVVREYEATAAARDALLALADHALLRGRPTEARLILARLVRTHPGVKGSPAVRTRRAAAADRDYAEGGPPPSEAEGGGSSEPAPASAATSWPMLGGGPDRNRTVRDPVRFRPIQYAKFTHLLRRKHDLQRTRPRILPPPSSVPGFWRHWKQFAPIQPVVAQGLLVYHDGQQVFCNNLYTGVDQWVFPEQNTTSNRGRTNLSAIYTPVVKDGVVYASLEIYKDYREQSINGTPITYYLPTRRLFALDLQTGRVLWSHSEAALEERAQRGKQDHEMLGRLTLTGAPLVRGDRIYVGAAYSEGTFHTYLVAVDRHTGDLLFATHISDGQQELNLFGRQLQESVPTPVAEQDGVVYFGTNLGVVAAVDALTGSPLWAASYPIKSLPSTYLWFEAPRRWADFDNGPPLIVGDTLILAPADGTHLLALDRSDGRTRWRFRSNALGWRVRTVYGADSERVYVGGERIAALSLEPDPINPRKPRKLWETAELSEGESAWGRGVLTRDRLWVPTKTRIYAIDRATGIAKMELLREEEDQDYDMVVHLTVADGVLITAGRDVICARFLPEEVRHLAKTRVREAQGRTEPLIGAADIYLANGDLPQAIKYYRQARRRATKRGEPPLESRAGRGLHRALVLFAETVVIEDAVRGLSAFRSAIAAAPDDDARGRTRVKMDGALARVDGETFAEARLANLAALENEHAHLLLEGDVAAPVWALERTTALHLQRKRPRLALAALQRLLEVGGAESVRPTRRKIDGILSRWGRGLYAPYEARARELFARALQSRDPATLERALSLYPNSEVAVEASLDLARRSLGAGEPEDAMRILHRILADRPNSKRTAEALVLLTFAQHASRSHLLAFATLRRLAERHAAERADGPDGKPVLVEAFVSEWMAKEPYPALRRRAAVHVLRPPLQHLFSYTEDIEEGQPDVAEVAGLRPDALQDAAFLRSGSRLHVVDTRTTETLYELDTDDYPPSYPIVLAGERIHIVTSQSLFVFDALNGKLVRRRAIPRQADTPRLLEHEGQVFLIYSVRGGQGKLSLTKLHPITGKDLWRRRLSLEGQFVERFVLAWGGRLVLFAESPARMLTVSTMTGEVSEPIPLPGDRLPHEPQLLPSGRVLVPVQREVRAQGRSARKWVYELLLADPALPPEEAVLESYREPGQSTRPFFMRTLHVGARYLVIHDERGAAVVLQRDDLRVHRRVDKLDLGEPGRQGTYLAASGLIGERLIVVTAKGRRLPAQLAAFSLPDLEREYMVPAADTVREHVELVELSPGLIVLSLGPVGAAPRASHAGRVRLFDVHGRAIQDVGPSSATDRLLHAQAQDGLLFLVTRGSIDVFGTK